MVVKQEGVNVSMYPILKHLHLICVALSLVGFIIRGAWALTDSPLLKHRLTRVLPHVIDTVLLLSAVALAVIMAQYPLQAGWVTAKVVGLLAYIGLGTLALKRGRTRRVRAIAFVGALLVYGWIVSAALSKHPAGWVASLAGG